MNITWGDVRSAVHSKDYEMQARTYLWLNNSEMRHYLCSQSQWMHARGFYDIRMQCNEILEGNLDHMAHVAYLIMAGGHSEPWMHYAMELLKDVNNGPANAADVIWWWCSASDVLWRRIQDAGHTGVEKDLVWQLLCSAACWEMMRGILFDYGSLGLSMHAMQREAVCRLWPCKAGFDFGADAIRCRGNGWKTITPADWVVCVSFAHVESLSDYYVDFAWADSRDKPFLQGIKDAKRALGTWVEEDDLAWEGDDD